LEPVPEPTPELDERFLRRAIRLAMTGRGRVEPNPMVGCVIVKDGRVIGEGYHAHFGGPHAEPAALANCTESPEGATAYVTLEPCCHTNKKTPPCAPRLIGARLARVVVGCLDPNPEVNGNGVAMLRAAGIRVDGPVLEPAAKQLIAPFLKNVDESRPYVTLKWAQSADGKVAGSRGRRVQISDVPSSEVVHALRARCDGILVGIGTVLHDDPLLTARGPHVSRQLRRYVLDSRLRIPPDSKLVQTARKHPLTVFCYSRELSSQRAERLRAKGVHVVDLDAVGLAHQNDDPRLSLVELLATLQGDVTNLLVEPGPRVANSFLEADLADRIWVFGSDASLGEARAPDAPMLPSHLMTSASLRIGRDTLTEYLNPAGPAYFAPEASADFVLASEMCGTA
jgi:diaminohydroxyphosphoribosylaminopyrimidine deaminase/5-amino-6-(5-phosphoribosylamino)uracil reductase